MLIFTPTLCSYAKKFELIQRACQLHDLSFFLRLCRLRNIKQNARKCNIVFVCAISKAVAAHYKFKTNKIMYYFKKIDIIAKTVSIMNKMMIYRFKIEHNLSTDIF